MPSASRRLPVLGFLTALAVALAACAGPEPGPGPGPSRPADSSSSHSAPVTRAPGTPDAVARIGPGPTRSPGKAPSSAAAASAGCEVFPRDNVWRTPVARLPVHPRSADMIASIGVDGGVHPDFGSGLWEGAPIGIPVTTVAPGQARVPVRFEYADESDPGPYPVPRNARIEGGPDSAGDRHVIVWDRAACRVYELFAAYPAGDGSWRAGSGAVFDLRSNALRRAGWTSADASGLSILAGLVRYEEVASGRVEHAVRITVPRTRTGYTWPATHSASAATDPRLPQMGQRLRLRADVSTAGMPRQARVVAEAMKTYGVIVADHGSPWFISGSPDDRWDNDALRALKALRGDDFEAVDVSRLIVSARSGAVQGR